MLQEITLPIINSKINQFGLHYSTHLKIYSIWMLYLPLQTKRLTKPKQKGYKKCVDVHPRPETASTEVYPVDLWPAMRETLGHHTAAESKEEWVFYRMRNLNLLE